MVEDISYTIERYTTEIDAKVYIEDFRRADYFIKLCQQCGNYGRRYGCPPFDNDSLNAIKWDIFSNFLILNNSKISFWRGVTN